MKFKVVAMPELVDPTDFGLDNYATNRRLAKEWFSNKVETISGIITNPDYELFRTGSWESGGYIILINKVEGYIAYFVNFLKTDLSQLKISPVVQVAVWRNFMDLEVVGITKKIFFDLLLNKFDSILCDQEHTLSGRRFWLGVLAQSAKLRKHIAYINNTTITWWDPKEDIQLWLEKYKNAWGIGPEFRSKRFLITN
jgi:hypothetical protein